jgi:methylmalonyl-CoA mutase C-terminal domain/subunit
LPQKKPSAGSDKRIRVLVAKPGLDGHDRGALILCRALRDVDVVAMSLLNGAHMTAFPKVAKLIREKGGDEILLVGGGIIPDDDKPRLEKLGITGNYGPGTTLKTIIDHVERIVRERDSKKPRRN